MIVTVLEVGLGHRGDAVKRLVVFDLDGNLAPSESAFEAETAESVAPYWV